MRKYEDCIRSDGLCGICSSSVYDMDCHGKKISPLLYQRSLAEITQSALAEASGVNIRQIQKYESGECDCGNMSLRTAAALSEVLGCLPENLIPND